MDHILRERTVVILGPIKTTMQNLVMGLTQEGADVAMIDADADKLQRFAQNVTDQREANSKLGRAAAISVNWSDDSSVKEAFSKAAQSFGSIDIYIDALSSSNPTPLKIGESHSSEIDQILNQNLATSLKATQTAAHFLKSRKKGRIIYFIENEMLNGNFQDAIATAGRTGLVYFSQTLARELLESNVTVNCLSLGLSEEYLLGHFPETNSLKEAVEKMKATNPKARIADPQKITQAVTFLCGPSGASVTGQNIILN